MKKVTYAACLLCITLYCILFAGCNNTSENVDTEGSSADTEIEEPVEIVLLENGSSNIHIVIPEKPSNELKDGAVDLLAAIGNTTTPGLKFVFGSSSDTVEPGVLEIIIGDAPRDAVADAKSKLKKPHDYIITMSGDSIVVYSENQDEIKNACELLVSMIDKDNGRKTLTLNGDIYHSYEYAAENSKISGISVTEYSIVIPSDSGTEAEIAASVQSLVYENTGATLPIKLSSEPASDCEILIGNNSRSIESKYYVGDNVLSKNEYAIETSGTKLICAATAASKRGFLAEFSELLLSGGFENLTLRESSQAILPSLDGKKVLFIGNSHTYYGGNVTTTRGPNTRDTGWFYQIAKTFGENVTVVNMTYPGEKFIDLYPRLTEQSEEWFKSFDAVVMQQAGTANDSTSLLYGRKIRDLFEEDTVFVYIITEYCIRNNQTYTLNAAQTLKEEGMLIAGWGYVAWTLMDGKAQGMTHTYTKTTFRVNKNDTFHPNTLSGYITALTCYATLTGKKVEGSDYSFIKDSYLNNFIQTYYTAASDTNIIEIFHDADEIRRIQALVDAQVAEDNNR